MEACSDTIEQISRVRVNFVETPWSSVIEKCLRIIIWDSKGNIWLEFTVYLDN